MADTALTRRVTMIISPDDAPKKAKSSRALGFLLAAGVSLMAGVLLLPLSLESKSASPTSPCPRLSASDVDNRLDRHVISKVVHEHYPAFLACYERVLRSTPIVRAEMHFTISATGAVTGGHVDSEAPALGTCMEPVMMHFVFPPPEGGAQTVDFPIAFAPG